MSKQRNRGTGSRRSRKPRRPLAATAAAIGGAGIVLAAPGAAFMAAPEAQAQTGIAIIDSLFGLTGLSGVSGTLVGTATGLEDTFFAIAGQIPILNAFIGNGADGTAENPDGGNAGIIAGNGGTGYSFTVAADGAAAFGAAGGNGGNAGLFIGNGGNGGNGGPGNALLATPVPGGNGGNGGAGLHSATATAATAAVVAVAAAASTA